MPVEPRSHTYIYNCPIFDKNITFVSSGDVSHSSISLYKEILIYVCLRIFIGPMNSKLFLMVVVVITAFGVATAMVSPVTIATPALAQNVTGGNVTAGNVTG
jgi:hypothetical protein